MSDDRDHQLNCLARWVLSHYSSRAEILACLGRMEKRNGSAFTDDLRRRMNIERGISN